MFIVYAERGGNDTNIRLSSTTFLRLSGTKISWFSVIPVCIVCDLLCLVMLRPMLLYVVFQAGLAFNVHTLHRLINVMFLALLIQTLIY